MGERDATPEEAAAVPLGRPLAVAFGASLVICVLLFAVSYWAWAQVPPGTRIPMHWNAAGRVNGYGGRGQLFLVPGVVLGMTLLFRFIPQVEPRKANLLFSSRAYQTVWLAVVLFLAGLQGAIIRAAFGQPGSMGKWIVYGVGALMIIVGNALGQVRSNFIFGVRTPWTLSSELSWNRTHRLARWMLVAFGLLEMVGALAQAPGKWLAVYLVAFVAILLTTTFIYSYCVWRSDPDRSVTDATRGR